jgi:hypothetical protein
VDTETVDAIRRSLFWFEADIDGFGRLVDFIGDADVVLIGEALMGPRSTTESELS